MGNDDPELGHALVDYGRLLDVVRLEGERLSTVAHQAAEDAPVPGCPGLTLGETARHVGSVYRAVLGWIRDRQRPTGWSREPAVGQTTGEYLRAGLAELSDELAAHDPLEWCATWWPRHERYGFWCRRMAHESTIHRADVERAAGTDLSEIPEDVALDGIDEVLLLWFGYRLGLLGVSGTRAGTVAVRTQRCRWLVRAGPADTSAWRAGQDERADAEVSGAPAELYQWLWGRLPTTAVRIEGDDDAVAQVWALLRLATR